MGAGEIPRRVSGQPQELDPNQAGGRQDRRSREAQEAGARSRSDVRVESQSRRDGREEEAGGSRSGRRQKSSSSKLNRRAKRGRPPPVRSNEGFGEPICSPGRA